jgi:hypothetical protein
MMHAEQEEALRRALHAVADTIEPAADGLERIRERLSRPRPLAVAWLVADWTVVARPVLLRLEEAAGWLSARLSAWLRLLARSLRPAIDRLRPAIDRLRPAIDRLRPAAGRLLAAVRWLRPGPGMSRHEKLRSAIAFGAAALVGTAGGYALADGLPQQVFSAAFSPASSSKSHPTSHGGHNSGLYGTGGQQFPQTSGAAPGGKRRPSPTPGPSCSPKPLASARPAPTASPAPTQASPSPTQASPSPTQASPSQTATPTPSQTSGSITSPGVGRGADIVIGVTGSAAALAGPSRAASQALRAAHPAASTKPTARATGASSPPPLC